MAPSLPLVSRVRRRLRELLTRLESEQGIALPAVLILLLVITLISTAAVATSTSGIHQAQRDRGVKRAVASADAGISTATYRLNKLAPQPLMCVTAGVNGLLTTEGLQPDGWCRPQTETMGDSSSYSYQVSAGVNVTVNGQALIQRMIVSTGAANGVTRRVLATLGSATGRSLFGGYAVISLSDLNMPESTIIRGNSGSNGNISLTNSATICGNATPGPGKSFTTANTGSLCPGFTSTAATQPFVLNPIDQGSAATVNDNGRIALTGPDVLNPGSQTVWDPATRVLKLANQSVLTLGGNVYSFCNLEIDNNAQLVVGQRTPTQPPMKIYIDSPENCPGVSNAGSVRLRNGASIANLNDDPTTFYLYVLGSPQIATKVDFLNNFEAEVPMVIYAPQSAVTIQNHTTVVGAVAAKTVALQNNTGINWHERVGDVTVDGLSPLFRRQEWIECRSRNPGPAPDAGC